MPFPRPHRDPAPLPASHPRLQGYPRHLSPSSHSSPGAAGRILRAAGRTPSPSLPSRRGSVGRGCGNGPDRAGRQGSVAAPTAETEQQLPHPSFPPVRRGPPAPGRPQSPGRPRPEPAPPSPPRQPSMLGGGGAAPAPPPPEGGGAQRGARARAPLRPPSPFPPLP